MEVEGQASSFLDLFASLDEHMDIAEWINKLLGDTGKGHQPGSVPDVSELATRLEVACQDTSSQLERTIDDISRAVPRLTYDLHFLRDSALNLKQALTTLQGQLAVSIADQETTRALDKLSYLDSVKRHMEASRDVLKEAENWSTLESEVTSFLADLQYAKAAERLAEASRSMVVFHNTAEFENRRALMTSLQNQLEASLSSALVAAINSKDLASCKNYYSVFSNIQREGEFRNYYNGSRRTPLIELWTTASFVDIDGEPGKEETKRTKFTEFLSNFYRQFLIIIREEQVHCPAIFPDPQQAISSFIQTTIDALTPSLSQRLSSVADHYGGPALPELIRAFRITEDFAVAVDKIMEKIGFATLFSPQVTAGSEDPIKSHSRRLSKRMSMSRRIGPPLRHTVSISGKIFNGNAGGWEQALFEPFVDIQSDYEPLEKKFLEHSLYALHTRVSDNEAALSGESLSARIFREQSQDVFSMAEDSIARCMDLTHGYGSVGLLQSLDYLFTTFLNTARSELLGSSAVSSSTPTVPIPDEALDELEYSAKDWGTIQLTLYLLDACRVIRERLSLLEHKLRAALVQIANIIRLSRTDSQGLYVPNTTRGEVLLLSQSTLNSAELNTLLESLDVGNFNINPGQTLSSPAEEAVTTTSLSLLEGTRDILVTFARACQTMLQETLLSPLFQHLASYTSLSIWTATDTKQREPGSYELRIPTFSLSPTPTIQRVSEGLLNLPRLFEVYAEDDALAFSIESLPFVDAESFQLILNPTPVPLAEAPPPSRHLRRLSSAVSSTVLIKSPTPTHTPLPSTSQHLPPELIVSTWLTSLSLSLLSHLTRSVLPSIPTLSPRGAAQLSSDLGYLSNVVRALNVEWNDLEKWKEYAEMNDDVGKEKASKAESSKDNDIFIAVAKMRGWT
ncbi:hypothetical protein Clacol_007624 [Clathrus columnatus]|uniref:Conserved oligomeric Golgi complex subunit 7 n=1 Tax=Clathrus columnatus TaxID=1419009 RepID=A0AAV5AHZ1_9AGAM|nr:hypothetical protein Clacol_007624 [Clathrus columnatus]